MVYLKEAAVVEEMVAYEHHSADRLGGG